MTGAIVIPLSTAPTYDLESIRRYALAGAAEEKLLASIQRLIVLPRKKRPTCISEAIAPHNKYFGVMLPFTPLPYEPDCKSFHYRCCFMLSIFGM